LPSYRNSTFTHTTEPDTNEELEAELDAERKKAEKEAEEAEREKTEKESQEAIDNTERFKLSSLTAVRPTSLMKNYKLHTDRDEAQIVRAAPYSSRFHLNIRYHQERSTLLQTLSSSLI
jgi:hypothetical protein